MGRYFSTFFTGFQDVVKTELTKNLPDVQIELLTDGLVIYQTAVAVDQIAQLPFLNNSFVLLEKLTTNESDPTSQTARIFLKNTENEHFIGEYFSQQKQSFRIRAVVENQFVSFDKNLLRQIEEKITAISPLLTVDRSLPDTEILITTRSEGFSLVGIQFTHRPNYEKTLQKGELYPELAYLLCVISEPQAHEVFLDPLAGHGSIVKQLVNHFDYQKIIVGDRDNNLVAQLQKKFGTYKNIEISLTDVLDMRDVTTASVDTIVTDPPWGFYEAERIDIASFYQTMLGEFQRVLKPQGLMVILTAQKELLENLLLEQADQLELLVRFDTLVSGKKAGVYKIRRR